MQITVDGTVWHAPTIPFPGEGLTRSVMVRLPRPGYDQSRGAIADIGAS
jgi:hypothetical protein